MKEYIETLDKVLPVVVRVHGKEHPELSDIHACYQILKQQIENKEDTKETVEKIRQLTNQYTLPEDACQAYEKVYHALKMVDGLLQ